MVCEMKLAEWLLNRPGALKEAYFDRAAYAAFRQEMEPVHELFRQLRVDFAYRYYSVAQWGKLLALPEDVRMYLQRYV